MSVGPELAIAVALGVGVLVAVAIRAAVRTRRSRLRAHREGPGALGVSPVSGAWRRFTLALAAPYRHVERASGGHAVIDPGEVWFGYRPVGGEQGMWRIRTALRRDWGVRNRPTAQDALDVLDDRSRGHLLELVADRRILVRDLIDMLESLEVPDAAVERTVTALRPRAEDPPTIPSPDAALIAFDLARGANLVCWSAGVPFVSVRRAEESLDLLGVTALLACDGWSDFGEHYSAGLRQAGAPRAGEFVRAAEWLGTDPASPWRRQPWVGTSLHPAPVIPGQRPSSDVPVPTRAGAHTPRGV